MSEVIAIVGSRSLPPEAWSWVEQVLFKELHDIPASAAFVSGGARGADKMGERFVAMYRRKKPRVIRPDYRQHGDRAPLERNSLIAYVCTRMIALVDERVSSGTGDVTAKAKKWGKPVRVFTYTKQGTLL